MIEEMKTEYISCLTLSSSAIYQFLEVFFKQMLLFWYVNWCLKLLLALIWNCTSNF